MSKELIEQIHTQIQDIRSQLDSNPDIFKTTWENPIAELQNHQEIARLNLIENIKHVLTNSSTYVNELTHQNLYVLQRLKWVCKKNIEATPSYRRINFEGPELNSKLPNWEDVPLYFLIFSGVFILDALSLSTITSIIYLAGAGMTSFTILALPILICISVAIVFALTALMISAFNNKPSFVQQNIDRLYTNVRHYNEQLRAIELFYGVKHNISTHHPDELSAIRTAFDKYQAIIIKDNMVAADPLRICIDMGTIINLNSNVALQCKNIVTSSDDTDTEYTRAKKELLQVLLKHAYQKDNMKRFDQGDNEVFTQLKASPLSPERIHHYLNRFESIQNQKSLPFFTFYSRKETVGDLLNDMNKEISQHPQARVDNLIP